MINVLDIIDSIEKEKKAKNIYPSHAMMSEITNEATKRIKRELNDLVASEVLSWCETINSIGFTINRT